MLPLGLTPAPQQTLSWPWLSGWGMEQVHAGVHETGSLREQQVDVGHRAGPPPKYQDHKRCSLAVWSVDILSNLADWTQASTGPASLA